MRHERATSARDAGKRAIRNYWAGGPTPFWFRLVGLLVLVVGVVGGAVLGVGVFVWVPATAVLLLAAQLLAARWLQAHPASMERAEAVPVPAEVRGLRLVLSAILFGGLFGVSMSDDGTPFLPGGLLTGVAAGLFWYVVFPRLVLARKRPYAGPHAPSPATAWQRVLVYFGLRRPPRPSADRAAEPDVGTAEPTVRAESDMRAESENGP